MKSITDIPFVSHIGIRSEKDRLLLELKPDLSNHLDTLHAGAIYTLAESESGRYLLEHYANKLDEDIIPLLRSSLMRYKKPIYTTATAKANVLSEDINSFEKSFAKKGRGSIKVFVEIFDEVSDLCAVGEFVWYVQLSN